MNPVLSHLSHNPWGVLNDTRIFKLPLWGALNDNRILEKILWVFVYSRRCKIPLPDSCWYRMFLTTRVGFSEFSPNLSHLFWVCVAPFSPVSRLCGATVYCAESSETTCLVDQTRKPGKEMCLHLFLRRHMYEKVFIHLSCKSSSPANISAPTLVTRSKSCNRKSCCWRQHSIFILWHLVSLYGSKHCF